MKVYDCTLYHDEDLILELRFNILSKFVDKFVICESKFSHSGRSKKLNFDINNYKKFKDKIIYLVIENEPEGLKEIQNNKISSTIKRMNSIKRIEQSYNYMLDGIKNASEDDLIILSDNDEIPNLNSNQFKNFKKDIIIFKQQ